MTEVKVEEAIELVWNMARDLFRMRAIEAFYIVGSWAKGTQREDVSDIDVLISVRYSYIVHVEKYLISKCALDGIFGLPLGEIVKSWNGEDIIASSFTPGSAWFYIPDTRMHGFIHPSEYAKKELRKPYIEVTKRKRGILNSEVT